MVQLLRVPPTFFMVISLTPSSTSTAAIDGSKMEVVLSGVLSQHQITCVVITSAIDALLGGIQVIQTRDDGDADQGRGCKDGEGLVEPRNTELDLQTLVIG